MKGFMTRLRDERGISAVIVAVSLIGLLGAAVLAIDAGSSWATRRKIVTSTDAAAVAAARMYAQGLADPCSPAGVAAGQSESTTVLQANAADVEPVDYQVSVSGCPSAPVGHVRVDARLGAKQAFSGVFGFNQTKPYSSSTAQFGYLIALPGLRPIGICDQSSITWDQQPVAAPPGPAQGTPAAWPHYALWNWLRKGRNPAGPAPYNATFTQTDYDKYWGSLVSEYPLTSILNPDSLNNSKPYLPITGDPATSGGVVHRINAKDSCGGPSEWRGWVDLNGVAGSGTSDLIDWMVNGYDGVVNLGDSSATPPEVADCPEGDGSAQCDVQTGNHNGIKSALNDPSVLCPALTPSRDCPVFPIILDHGVDPYNADSIHAVGFLFVIMRGWGSMAASDKNPCNGNDGCVFDFEFVNIQEQGRIGHAPNGNNNAPRGTSLCGVDHDTTANRCNV